MYLVSYVCIVVLMRVVCSCFPGVVGYVFTSVLIDVCILFIYFFFLCVFVPSFFFSVVRHIVLAVCHSVCVELVM